MTACTTVLVTAAWMAILGISTLPASAHTHGAAEISDHLREQIRLEEAYRHEIQTALESRKLEGFDLTLITLAVTLLVAFSGYIAKYINDLRISQRKDRLDRVNRQLRELYGPLFSLVNVSTITWSAFKQEYCRRDDFEVRLPPSQEGQPETVGIRPQSEETERIWRHWMKSVFMPLNNEMAQLVIDHSDLLEEEDMPPCLLLLSAHVHGYKGILAAWKAEDFSEHMSLTPFPKNELFAYAEASYRKLKSRQARLLGTPN